MVHKSKATKNLKVRTTLLAVALSVLIAILVIVAGLLPGLLGYQPVSTHGTSMEPTLHDGDGLLVRYVGSTEVKVGDIVVLEHSKKGSVAHRLVRIEPLPQGDFILQTKGDANHFSEWSVVATDEKIGIALFRIPLVGSLLEFTHTGAGLILLFGSAVGLLVLSTILIRERLYRLDK